MTESINRYSWFKNLSQAQYLNLLAHLQRENEVHANNLEFKGMRLTDENNKLIEANIKGVYNSSWFIYSAIRSLSTINIEKIHSRKTVWKVLFKSIIPFIEEEKKLKNVSLHYSTMNQMKDRAIEFWELTRKLVLDYRRIDAEAEKSVLQNFDKDRSLSKIVKDPTTTPFPKVNIELEQVRELIILANTGNLSAEEEYFIEQTNQSYIRSIVYNSQDLLNADFKTRDEAEAEFLKQLEIIEQQIRSIIVASQQRTLSDVKIQTNFLTSKSEFAEGTEKIT